MSDDNASGHGSASPNEANRDTQPSGGLSEDQTKAVNDLVSKAIGKRFKEFETKQATTLKDFGTSLAASLTESVMGAVGQQLESLKPAEPATGTQTPTAQTLENDPHVKGLKKQIEQLTKQNADREATENATRAELKAQKLREKLTAELAKHGIEGLRASHAVGALVDAQKRVGYEDGSEQLTFKDESGDVVDISTGLKSWVSSEDGKLYAPPRQASGSGERGQSRQASLGNPSNGKQPSTSELGAGLSSVFGIPIG